MNGAGGAIRNATENLTISGSTINANSAVSGGGLHNNGGHLTVTSSTISSNTVLGNGAGIETLGGSLTITESTISGNSTPTGGASGGIQSSSSVTTIDSSTISGNSANYGGGVTHSGVGVLMTITNSTISGNSARVNGGGVSVVQGDLTVRHSTITGNRADSDSNGTGNGGGILVADTPSNVTIDHTIVAGNFRQAAARSDVFGSVAARYSLVGDNTDATITDNGGNQVGTGAVPIDPLLAPLQNNGGPTMSHLLLVGSPAIEAGDPAAMAGVGTVPLFDQRVHPYVRVADRDGDGTSRIDIGAIERPSLASSNFVVDVLVDEDDDNYVAGDLSLREAILLAEFNPGIETITFSPALTSGGTATILLTLGELAIRDSLSIEGPGAALLAVDGSGNDPTPEGGFGNIGDGSRVLVIDNFSSALADVAISGLTLTGADSDQPGGAIFSQEDLVIEECLYLDPAQPGRRATLLGFPPANHDGHQERQRLLFEELDDRHVEERSIQQDTPDFQAQLANSGQQPPQHHDRRFVPPHARESQRVPLAVIENAGRRVGVKLLRPLAGLAVIQLVAAPVKLLRSTASNASRSPPATRAFPTLRQRTGQRLVQTPLPARKAFWASLPPRRSSPPGRKAHWPSRGRRRRPRSIGPLPAATRSAPPPPCISSRDPALALLASTIRAPIYELHRSRCYNMTVNAWFPPWK